jgi:hypothetical protein
MEEELILLSNIQRFMADKDNSFFDVYSMENIGTLARSAKAMKHRYQKVIFFG